MSTLSITSLLIYRSPMSGPARGLVSATIRSAIRVLIIEPETALAQLIVRTLDRAPYETRVERTAVEAIGAIRGWRPALVIMHVDHGVARVIAALAEDGVASKLPIIGLIGDGEPAMRVAALDAGVDDLLTEPLVPEELRAHVRALVRRTYGPYKTVAELRVGHLRMNLVERCVHVGGVRVHLTSLEQALLYLLAADAGSIISRDTILDALWGVDYAPDQNVLERHVSRLRAKLRRNLPAVCRIETIRGQGYRLTTSDG